MPSSFHPHVGGVEEVVLQLAIERKRQGYNPLVITNRWPKFLKEREFYEELDVRRFVFRVPELRWRHFCGAVLFGPETLRQLLCLLRSHRTEVLHVHCVSSNAYYALWVKRLTGLPLVVTLHAELTMDASGLFQRSRYAQRLLRRTLQVADVVTACSARTLEDAERFLGSEMGGRARVIYNGTDTARFQGSSPYPHVRPYIFALGRMVPQKGFDILLKGYAALRAAGIRSHDLLLAGEGVEESVLKRLAEELDLNGSVRFLGRVARSEAARLFVGCDFHVLPSRGDEGLPMVLLESMSAGKPVIASRMGGIPEMVDHGSTGLLVEAENVGQLAKDLALLLRSPAQIQAMGKAALTKAQGFTWPVIANQYASAYRDAVVRSGAAVLDR